MTTITETTLAPLAALSRSIDTILDTAGQPDVRAIKEAVRDAFSMGNWLPAEAIKSGNQSYARHVLHSDPDRRYSVLALVWKQGQASPIHAHHAWCAYGVIAGELLEERFEYDLEARAASPTGNLPRKPGDGSCGLAGLEQIHRIRNIRRETAISVHVYGVPAAEISSGVNNILPLSAAAIA